MRVLIVLSVIVVAAVFAERCPDDSACKSTQCVTDSVPKCIKHICTCVAAAATAPPPANCTMRSDCDGMVMNCRAPHCLDGMCKCFH